MVEADPVTILERNNADKKVMPVATISTSEAPDKNLFVYAGFCLWTTSVKNLLWFKHLEPPTIPLTILQQDKRMA